MLIFGTILRDEKKKSRFSHIVLAGCHGLFAYFAAYLSQLQCLHFYCYLYLHNFDPGEHVFGLSINFYKIPHFLLNVKLAYHILQTCMHGVM